MWRTPAENAMAKWSKDGIKPDVIIVDPPRKGLTESFLKPVLPCNLKRLPTSHVTQQQWRDIKLYQELGFELEESTTGWFISRKRTTWECVACS